MTRLRWSPVASAATWDESLVLARAMSAGSPAGRRVGPLDRTGRGAYGAVAPRRPSPGAGMRTVLRWVLRQETRPAGPAVERGGHRRRRAGRAGRHRPARAVGNLVDSRRRPRRLPLRRRARHAASAANFDPQVARRAPATPSTCAPRPATRTWWPRSWSPSSSRFGPGLTRRGRRGTPGPPLTLVLDEVANIAPLPDLPAMVSEGGGQGVAHSGLPPGSVPGQAAVGPGGRWVPVFVRDQVGSARDRRPGHPGTGVPAGRRDRGAVARASAATLVVRGRAPHGDLVEPPPAPTARGDGQSAGSRDRSGPLSRAQAPERFGFRRGGGRPLPDARGRCATPPPRGVVERCATGPPVLRSGGEQRPGSLERSPPWLWWRGAFSVQFGAAVATRLFDRGGAGRSGDPAVGIRRHRPWPAVAARGGRVPAGVRAQRAADLRVAVAFGLTVLAAMNLAFTKPSPASRSAWR